MRAGAARCRGSVAILAAFLLLALMASAAFATGRNLMRELEMCGDAVRGAKAAAAAESGLAWCLAQPRLDPGTLCAPEGLLGEPPGEAFQERFELRIQDLGLLPPATGNSDGPPERLWQVTSTGHCGLKGQAGDDFVQVRELLVAGARGPDRPHALRVLAWRVVIPMP